MAVIPKSDLLARLHAVIAQVRSAPAICGSVLLSDLVAIEDALESYELELAGAIEDDMARAIGAVNDQRQAQRLRESHQPVTYQSAITGRWGQDWRKRRAS